jgi:hypothetical protein
MDAFGAKEDKMNIKRILCLIPVVFGLSCCQTTNLVNTEKFSNYIFPNNCIDKDYYYKGCSGNLQFQLKIRFEESNGIIKKHQETTNFNGQIISQTEILHIQNNCLVHDNNMEIANTSNNNEYITKYIFEQNGYYGKTIINKKINYKDTIEGRIINQYYEDASYLDSVTRCLITTTEEKHEETINGKQEKQQTYIIKDYYTYNIGLIKTIITNGKGPVTKFV